MATSPDLSVQRRQAINKLKIAVVGGSVGGLFAAALLLRAGFEVTVYERSRGGLEGRGAGLVAQREVFSILRDIGCEHVARVGVVASERIYLDRSGAIARLSRTPQTQISWDVLFRTFRAQVPEGRYLNGAAVRSIEHDADDVTLVFEDGTRVVADLVISRRVCWNPGRATKEESHSVRRTPRVFAGRRCVRRCNTHLFRWSDGQPTAARPIGCRFRGKRG